MPLCAHLLWYYIMHSVSVFFLHRRSVAKLKLARDLIQRNGGLYLKRDDPRLRPNQSLGYLNSMAHEGSQYLSAKYFHKSGDFTLPDGCTLLPNGKILPPRDASMSHHPLMDKSFPSSREDSLELISLDPPYKAAISYTIPNEHPGTQNQEDIFTPSKEDAQEMPFLSTLQSSPISELLRFRNANGTTSNYHYNRFQFDEKSSSVVKTGIRESKEATV